MEKSHKVPNSFRTVLKKELALWQKEGLINPDQASVFTDRYNLDQIATESKNILLATIYTIGVLLVAGGVISFVAAHWDAMARSTKVTLIISFMLACYVSGYYLWQITGKYARLGHGLVLLGVLMFGANIGLLAQIFHIKSNFYNGFGAWAFGAVILAWALASVPVMAVAVATSFIYYAGFAGDMHTPLHWYPLIIVLAFVSFAFLQRSTFTYVLGMVAIGLSLIINTTAGHDHYYNEQFGIALGALAAAMFIYFSGALLEPKLRSFSQAGKIIGTAFFAFAIYVGSFWQNRHSYSSHHTFEFIDVLPLIIAFIVAVGFAVWYLLRKENIRILPITIAAGILLAPLAFCSSDDFTFTIMANLLCIALSAGLIASSLRYENRGLFWAGSLFLVLVIVSRFFEIESALLLKSAAFTASGLGLIFGAVWFERYLKSRRHINE